jgi:hypothetical protein
MPRPRHRIASYSCMAFVDVCKGEEIRQGNSYLGRTTMPPCNSLSQTQTHQASLSTLAGLTPGSTSSVIGSWRRTTVTATALVRPSDSDSWSSGSSGGGIPSASTAERRDTDDEFAPLRSLSDLWMRTFPGTPVRRAPHLSGQLH